LLTYQLFFQSVREAALSASLALVGVVTNKGFQKETDMDVIQFVGHKTNEGGGVVVIEETLRKS
jgi:hypothetical protein